MNFVKIFQRQISGKKKYFPEIDGLRFIAISTVVFYHIIEYFSIKNNLQYDSLLFLPFKNGAQGVQLFFVISGFILALPFASKYPKGETISIKNFFLRRLTRLEPPYILSMLVFFTIIIYFNKVSFNELFGHLIASIFYIHNIVFGKGSDINTVAWSLEVEIQFYLLVPLLAQLFKLSKRYRRSVFLILIVLFIITNFCFDLYFRTLLAQFHYFLLGLLLADVYISKDVKIIKSNIIGAIGLLLVIFINREDGNWQELAFFVGCALLFSSAILNPFWKKVFSIKPLAIIGGMCYSIYLLHYPLISFIGRILNNILNPNSTSFLWLYFFIILPVILIFSGIFYLLIEKPCMDNEWPKKLMHFFKKNKSL